MCHYFHISDGIFLVNFSCHRLSFEESLSDSVIGTVITSFPNAWEGEKKHDGLKQELSEKPKPLGLKKRLDDEINLNITRPAIESVDHLVHLIIKLSVDFLRRDAPGGIKFQDAFQSSINNIVRGILPALSKVC